MSQHINLNCRPTGLFLLALSAVSFAGKPPVQVVRLADSVPTAIQQSFVIGAPAPSQVLHLSIVLHPANAAGLQDFVDSVSNPHSPNYRHFITPEQVGADFGAAKQDVDNVVAYLKSQGMTITRVAKNRMVILADTTVAQAQQTFATRIKTLTGPNGKGEFISYNSNIDPVALPSTIAGVVLCVGGLNNYSQPTPRTTLTPPLARGLYNTAPSYATGTEGQGCSIAYSNWDGFLVSNAGLYISNFSLPVPSGGSMSNIHIVSVHSGTHKKTQAEGDLDMQMELTAAPLADIYIYDDPTGGDLLGVLTAEQDDNIADIVSESYGWNGIGGTYADSCHLEHLSMNAQGMTYVAASGDSGTSDLINDPYPDVDPEITNVGGTVASVNTTTGVRITEVGWSGSGGGWSTASIGTVNFNVQPSWQVGRGVPTNGFRLVPDVSLQASSSSGGAFKFYYKGALSSGYVGTSFASPFFAGALATLEQRLAANGQARRFGRINDLIYSENGRSDIWFDILTGSNGSLPDTTTGTAGVGWDFVSGWGPPDFDAWYNVLAIQTIIPTSDTLFRGSLFSGTTASLDAIDQSYLKVIEGPTLNGSEAPVQVIVNGTAQLATVSNLEIDVTAHSTSNIAQSIDVFNWTTNAYVTVDTRAASTTDSTVKVAIPNANQFIQSGSKAVRARIRYSQTGPTIIFPWSASLDQVVWKATPN